MMGLRAFLGLQKTPTVSPHRLALLRRMPKAAICAEIGVWHGNFSAHILAETEPAELHLIDPWAFAPHYPNRMYGGRKADGQPAMDTIADKVRQRFAHDPRVRVQRMRSDEFFASLGDKRLDWVYIDGDHSKHAVLADLRGAWKAVRAGGIIAGDDYHWRDQDGSHAVKEAVEQFAEEQGARYALTGNQYAFDRT